MRFLILPVILVICIACSGLGLLPQRSDRYFNCLKELYREGISQDKLEDLCNAAIGANKEVK